MGNVLVNIRLSLLNLGKMDLILWGHAGPHLTENKKHGKGQKLRIYISYYAESHRKLKCSLSENINVFNIMMLWLSDKFNVYVFATI